MILFKEVIPSGKVVIKGMADNGGSDTVWPQNAKRSAAKILKYTRYEATSGFRVIFIR